ncbi:MAG: UvrD-helicase domain-containing protein, partial [Gammaproteobacteria bacterium]|nr:UvrD-helicase domain-containing protein [Gammaproteobacteria bacterium]
IQHGSVEPGHIAAITFTNKAAREMQQRLRQQTRAAADVRVSTFHTLGLAILRDDPDNCGVRPRFTILSQSDAIGVLEDLIRAGFDNDAVRAEAMLASISAWKNRLLDPQQALEDANGQPLRTAAARCYGQYQERLQAWNAVDFDDLIMRPARALANNEDLLRGWQHKIRFLLIDEYQDTNAAQYELVKLLAGTAARVTAVGDDDQSIYAWRGARPENLALLKRDYPHLKVIKLEQNYRSTGTILKAANVLIANNDHLFEKRLWTDTGFGDPIRVMQCTDEADEAARVADMIAYQRVVKRREFGDFAILYRGNYQARVFEQALRERRIPYFVSGGPSFFDLAEVKDILAYLRIAANGDDDNAFLRVINRPRRSMGNQSLQLLVDHARIAGQSLATAGLDAGRIAGLSARARRQLGEFCNWLASTRESGARPGAFIAQLLADIDYDAWLERISDDEDSLKRRRGNVAELVDWIERIERADNVQGIDDMLSKLMIYDIAERRDDPTGDEVALMTLHAAKGLEFPFLFMVGLEENLLPHRNSIDAGTIEEERRLMYVGITRAKQNLTLSLAARRRRFGKTSGSEPSRFLEELPEEALRWDNKDGNNEPDRDAGTRTLAGLKSLLQDT